jgi:periodic tryptophan protein 2
VWDAADGGLLARLDAHQKPVLTLAFAPNGKHLVSGSGDNTVRLWGVEG